MGGGGWRTQEDLAVVVASMKTILDSGGAEGEYVDSRDI